MDRQKRKVERDLKFSVMNFSGNEILKFISKVFVVVLASLFFQVTAFIFIGPLYRPSTHCCSEFFI
ncbi:hypothetical protein SAMN04487896_0427 [Paenibacillus sp. ov031]|nr:hypothetical protein SAMN03159332_1078 [Paenibacillus sp. 276b]SHN53746.1 hypothetical protein SAMN04487896_0427 [Paenibacillus sp. ov031]